MRAPSTIGTAHDSGRPARGPISPGSLARVNHALLRVPGVDVALVVDPPQAFKVEAPFPDLVRTKLLQQFWIPVLNATNEVQNEVCLVRREPDQRRHASTTTVVAIAVGPKPTMLVSHITGVSPVHSTSKGHSLYASSRRASLGTLAIDAVALSWLGSVFWDAMAAAPILPACAYKLTESSPGRNRWPPGKRRRFRGGYHAAGFRLWAARSSSRSVAPHVGKRSCPDGQSAPDAWLVRRRAGVQGHDLPDKHDHFPAGRRLVPRQLEPEAAGASCGRLFAAVPHRPCGKLRPSSSRMLRFLAEERSHTRTSSMPTP